MRRTVRNTIVGVAAAAALAIPALLAAPRADVVDEVLDAHVRDFEAPADEDQVVVDARDTKDPAEIARLVAAIRAAA